MSVKTQAQEIYKDPKQSITDRVNDLVSKMTLEEKVSQLMMSKNIMWDETGKIKTKQSKEIFSPSESLDRGLGGSRIANAIVNGTFHASGR